MDSDAIQINENTPIEVEYSFHVYDNMGRNRYPALIRYTYSLFFKDYFKRINAIINDEVLNEVNSRLTYDTLYCDRKRKFVSNNIERYRRIEKTTIIFTPDIPNVEREELIQIQERYSLRCIELTVPVLVSAPLEAEIYIPVFTYKYPINKEWEDILNEVSQLDKLINNRLSRKDLSDLYFDVYNSYYVVDSIIIPDICEKSFPSLGNMVLEFKQYKNIPGTTKTYRIDSANTNTQTQKHIHVYFDGKQIYAINADGSPHDGSKYRISKIDQKFLASQGFKVPENGILELYVFKDGTKHLICETKDPDEIMLS